MNCSCHAPLVYTPKTYVGTQIYRNTPSSDPWLVLALFNCAACGSTRAAILFDAVPAYADAELEAIAAE